MQFNLMRKQWDGICIDYGQMFETGGSNAVMPQQGIAVAFAPHDRVVWSVDGGDHHITAMPTWERFSLRLTSIF